MTRLPRTSIELKMGNHYPGGPTTTRYYVAHIRVPRWAWRRAYRARAPPEAKP